jgi:hypothetical protein
MYVPGLTGTWRDRADQYMRALTGKPYDGSLQTGLYLLDQIKKRNFPQAKPAPKPAPAPAPAPAPKPAPEPAAPVVDPVVDLARQYTDPLTGQLKRASEIPQFENLLNWNQAWQRFEEPAMAMAKEQLRPEAMRQYKEMYEGLMGNLVSRGGQRFGRGFDQSQRAGGGLAGLGSLKAASERNYGAQTQDWLNAIKGGFSDLWYTPSAESWNEARMQVKPGETFSQTPDIPSWESLYGDISQKYGIGGSPGGSLLYS